MWRNTLSQDFMDSVSQLVEDKSIYEESISEMLMIQQQTALIMEISKRQKNLKGSLLSNQIECISFEIPENQQPHFNRNNLSISCIDFKKQLSVTKDDETMSIYQALTEIRNSCSTKTFQIMRDKMNSRQFFRNEKILKKEKQFTTELSKRCMKLTQQVAEYQTKIKGLEEKISRFVQNQKKVYHSQKKHLDREEALVRMEKTIVYKQKILNGNKKKIAAQVQLLQEENLHNQMLKTYLQTLLENLRKNNQLGRCRGKCWQNDAFQTFNQNLQTQKRLLKEKQQIIEKHYVQLREVTDIIKKEIK